MSEGAQIVKPTIAQIFSEFLAEQERRLFRQEFVTVRSGSGAAQDEP